MTQSGDQPLHSMKGKVHAGRAIPARAFRMPRLSSIPRLSRKKMGDRAESASESGHSFSVSLRVRLMPIGDFRAGEKRIFFLYEAQKYFIIFPRSKIERESRFSPNTATSPEISQPTSAHKHQRSIHTNRIAARHARSEGRATDTAHEVRRLSTLGAFTGVLCSPATTAGYNGRTKSSPVGTHQSRRKNCEEFRNGNFGRRRQQ